MKKQIPHPPKPRLAKSLFLVLGGVLLGAAITKAIPIPLPTLPGHEPICERQTGYDYVNPLLDCGIEFIEVTPSKRKLNDYIASRKSQGAITDASVYFRHLKNGHWFGLNERQIFSPASLLKVPMMMAFFKQAERDPGLRRKSIVFEGSPKTVPTFVPKGEGLTAGQSYPILELVERMIVKSDNDATYLVYSSLDRNAFLKLYGDLGVILDKSVVTQDESFMTIKQYATFFRVLYNASYLTPESSEYALSLLAKSEYKRGIVAGLEQGVVTAHKFGSREHEGVKQLHECGIVYAKEPYILCVMTRGSLLPNLEDTIKNISSIVYDDVKEQTETRR